MKDVAGVCQECAVSFSHKNGEGVVVKISSIDTIREIELLRTFAVCWKCFAEYFSRFATFGDSAFGGPFVLPFVPEKKSHT